MTIQRKSSPIYIPIAILAIVIGSIMLIRPIKSNGVLAKSFDFKPQLGAQMPVDAKLTDSDGSSHFFGEYFRSGRPVIFLPIFYKCNGVCAAETESLIKMLMVETALSTKRSVDSVIPGRDFDLVVMSIHPKETAELAQAKKAELMSQFREAWTKQTPEMQEKLNVYLNQGVHFTVATPDQATKLTDVMGFYYQYDERKDWVNHPAVAAFIATSGKIVAYNTGSNFQTKTVRNNIHESQKGVVQPLGDVFLLGCFKMEASSPRTRQIVQILNLAAIGTFLGISALIWRWNKHFPSNTLSSGPKDSTGEPKQL
jgi:protein SCO1/2